MRNTFWACSLVVSLLLWPAYGHATVSDASVKRWIITGSLGIDCAGPASTEADLSIEYPAETIYQSWAFLKACRDAGNSLDLELAAAEHYLFIRARASETGDTFYKILPSWYNSLKSFANFADLSAHLQTSDQPTAPPDADVKRWGEMGVEHGLRDYKTRTSEEPSAKTAAILNGFGFLKLRFYGE